MLDFVCPEKKVLVSIQYILKLKIVWQLKSPKYLMMFDGRYGGRYYKWAKVLIFH